MSSNGFILFKLKRGTTTTTTRTHFLQKKPQVRICLFHWLKKIQPISTTGLKDNSFRQIIHYVKSWATPIMTSWWRHQNQHFFVRFFIKVGFFKVNFRPEGSVLAQIWGDPCRKRIVRAFRISTGKVDYLFPSLR